MHGRRTLALRDQIRASEALTGRFVKTPHHHAVELAALDGRLPC